MLGPCGIFTLHGGRRRVTELFGGHDLYDFVATRSPWARGEERLHTLVRMHDRRLVHGNVKPANIMLELDADHGVERACLIDFGFCLPCHGAERAQVCGNVGYSPSDVVLSEHRRFSPLGARCSDPGADFYRDNAACASLRQRALVLVA